jgi:hypothetical protein
MIKYIGLLFFALSCSKQDAPKGLVKARILASTASGYKTETITFKTLESPDHLSSQILELRGKAVLSVDKDIEEKILSKDPNQFYQSRGGVVRTDYVVKNSVVYPKTYADMANLAIFYNFETTFTFWRDSLNLDTALFGRTTIYNNPTLKFDSDNLSGTAEPKFNASFVQGIRDFWFFKESTKALIPIKLNLAVLAHEFTHSIFDLYFANKDPSFYEIAKKDSDDNQAITDPVTTLDNEYMLSAINEGLADFFAWLVTGRKDELGASIESMAQTRVPPVNFRYSNYVDRCGTSFYCVGSLLNSALYEIAIDPDGVEKVQLGKYVLSALKNFGNDWTTEKGDDSNSFSMNIDKLVERIVAEEPDLSKKVKMCLTFKNWFDTIKDSICD